MIRSFKKETLFKKKLFYSRHLRTYYLSLLFLLPKFAYLLANWIIFIN